MLEVQQNILLCIVLSAVGGILEVFATAALAYPDAKKKEGKEWNSALLKLCLVVNVLLQITASTVGNLFAPWFGPVSIVGPTFLSAQLVANMIIYGYVLGLECFTKDMRVGTTVIVTAAVLLPVVGPQVQEDQDAAELMSQMYAHAWNVLLIFGMLISGTVLALRHLKLGGRVCQLNSEVARYAVLLTARATSFSVNLSYSKVFALQPDLAWFVVSIILKILSGAVMTGSIVVQSTAVSQNTFVPLNATAVILVNALTGIVVWEDWRSVKSSLGYATVFVQLVVGNYLLLGEVDLFGPQNKRYGRRLMFRRIFGREDLHISPATSLVESDHSADIDDDLNGGFRTDEVAISDKVDDYIDGLPQQVAPSLVSSETQEELPSSVDVKDDVPSALPYSPLSDPRMPKLLVQTAQTKGEEDSTDYASSAEIDAHGASRPSGPLHLDRPNLGLQFATSCATPHNFVNLFPSGRKLISPRGPIRSDLSSSVKRKARTPSPTGLPKRRSQSPGAVDIYHKHKQPKLLSLLHHEASEEEAKAAEARRLAWEQVFGIDDSYLEKRGAHLRKSFMTPKIEEEIKRLGDEMVEEDDETKEVDFKAESDSLASWVLHY